MELNNPYLLDHLRSIPDFPKKGINFRDVTTLFKDAKALEIMEEELYELYKDKGITKVVGLETRGYVMGAILARRLHAGFVMARKPGKLPYKTLKESYTKEYGEDTIEIHVDAIDENDVVLLHDDLLATGGTIKAAWNLVKKFNPKACYMNFVIEIRDEGLQGREAIGDGIEITTLLRI
ncbi:MAG: adenine phosphoribosyltransferase [Bacteroidaceae bacterium]|nr:adenine phosphoribosyltransferase [Bacteroidaceae bacterium]